MIATPQVFEIIDRESQEVIVRAPIIAEKTHKTIKTSTGYRSPITAPCALISGDFKHFFWRGGNDKYTCKIIENCQMPLVDYVERNDYTQVLWRSPLEKVTHADVIRDFSIDECDPEIQGLVYALNYIPDIRTTLSCCGHGKGPAWITLTCLSDQGFCRLMDILKDPTHPHYHKFYIDPTHASLGNISCGHGTLNQSLKTYRQFAIVTYENGEDAYIALKELEKHILDVYKDRPEGDRV